MPENEIPPAMRVDIYYNIGNYARKCVISLFQKSVPFPSRLRGRGVEVFVTTLFYLSYISAFKAISNLSSISFDGFFVKRLTTTIRIAETIKPGRRQ